MSVKQIIRMMDALSEAKTALASAQSKYERALSKDKKLAMLAADVSDIGETVATLTEDVKSAVLSHGDSVQTDTLSAVLNPGRVSWDTKALDGYAVAHPEIVKMRKHGDPFVTIREVKQKD